VKGFGEGAAADDQLGSAPLSSSSVAKSSSTRTGTGSSTLNTVTALVNLIDAEPTLPLIVPA
jgi:hypothetical protein